MHHKNHRFSTSNNDNPQHHKPEYSSQPAPQSGQKRSVLSRIRERFQEKPATVEEVKQLGLNAKRETYKTAIAKAKSSRPSRFNNFMGGGQNSGPSYRRSSRHSNQDEGSFLFGPSKSSGGGFLDMGSGPSLDFITGNNQKKGKNYKSGIEELF